LYKGQAKRYNKKENEKRRREKRRERKGGGKEAFYIVNKHLHAPSQAGLKKKNLN